ncbi:hypothetical protein BGP_3216 [Beggiatoa sp. PS]|nr:hypothetical protein BGP_3216 [Beggiatoa sp. PS]
MGEIIALLLSGGVVGTLIGAGFASRDNSKNLFVQTITNERATWREKLREETAEFCKIGYALSCQGKKDNDVANGQQKSPMDINRLRELGVFIRLRMNPDADLEHQVIKDTKDVTNKLSNGENNKEEIESLLVKVEQNIQRLLKKAWKVSKEEARTGKLAQDEQE